MNKYLTIYYEKQNNQLIKYSRQDNKFYLLSMKKNNRLFAYFIAIMIVVFYSIFKDELSTKFTFLAGIFIIVSLSIIIIYIYEKKTMADIRNSDSESILPVDIIKYLPLVKVQILSELFICIMGFLALGTGIILYSNAPTLFAIFINVFGIFLLYLEFVYSNLIGKLFVINKLKRREFKNEGLV